MNTQIFTFKSVGKKHEEETAFFKFLVGQEFSYKQSKAIQWCTVNELTITVVALSIEVVEMVRSVIEEGLSTNNGHKYILI